MYNFNTIIKIQSLIAKYNDKSLIIRDEIMDCLKLGETKDKKMIVLMESEKCPYSILEIGRLREITFRSVGEGTGKEFDLDEYDEIYKHIVLWDNEELEIVGSYRLGEIGDIIEKYGVGRIYNAELFNFSDKFIEMIKNSIELGRAFVQAKYWGTYALDYLWQGIGAYLSNFTNVKYLWGAVSISDSFPSLAKTILINYHKKWYEGEKGLVLAKEQFKSDLMDDFYSKSKLLGKNPQEDFIIMKSELKKLDVSCPVLLRKYVDLCEYGGTQFLDFGVDKSFSNSIDCFIIVDTEKIKLDFKKRYYTNFEEISS